ncbi:ArsR family transcriptional regulator [Antarcticibacterium sp. 1MA-6-2]|uniref:GbsR/MarR family transcriptional regulator n=1 Tax=Antarcticibacterium sp. 1MA-6-2 TaxID=2908210 RepID=UPI001F170463|nr:ArsR family transcriptional regulator [Antarcticibacterium sp. 1MA-6-2]UJH90021.1 ArsR family transcriptional regulator [Antarcticibacterium sp. 1MA-6-2]
MTEGLEKQKMELIEQLGVQLENDNLAPLAARVMATLILNGKQGVTFEKLVNELNASKSTISTHLEQLQVTNKIKYFTKPKRKKEIFYN